MAEYEQLLAREQTVREILARGAEAQLRAIPGVLHVSVGLKERAGAVTRQHSIRVYVREKLPTDRLSPADRIPREIDGVPTDVNVVISCGFTSNNSRYRPILGGIQISNRIIDHGADLTRTQLSRGTLGCIAVDRADRSIVLLSNWHVLMANSGRPGDRIYQPAPTTLPTMTEMALPYRPPDDTDAIARITRAAISQRVDGAIARVSVSSCCRCCGVDYTESIHGLSVRARPATNFIAGQRPAVSGMSVFKVGQSTGRTEGTVVDTTYPRFCVPRDATAYLFDDQIAIANVDSSQPFSTQGDSGAVVIDEDNFIIGLLFASSRIASPAPPGSGPPPFDPCAAYPATPGPPRSFANHISDVCSELNIEILFRESTTTAGAPIRRRVALPPRVEPIPEEYAAVREKVLSHSVGARLFATIDEHRDEVVHLVNHCRPVTVAWHRRRGPAFFAKVLNTLRAGGEEMPEPVDGVTADALLGHMMGVLTTHGSAPLRSAIAQHGETIVHAVRGSTNLDEALDKLASPAAAEL